MNTPRDDEDREDLRHAEYVLGVLDADARAEVEREIDRDPRAAADVARWRQHLQPLVEDIAPAKAPAYVWTRVLEALGPEPPHASRSTARISWWHSLALWRWLAAGAGAVAAASLILLVRTTPHAPAPPAAAAAYMTATILQENGVPGWTVTMDPAHARVVVVPAAPGPVMAGHTPELWLVPPGGKPIAIGVFARDRATTLSLGPQLISRLSAQALLAVSIEPRGGSPTGQPTGPVIGKSGLTRI